MIENPTVTLNGVEIILSPLLTEPGTPVQVQRSWAERLFTRPWRPFRAYNYWTPQVPRKTVYFAAGGKLIMHPALFDELKQQLDEDPGLQNAWEMLKKPA